MKRRPCFVGEMKAWHEQQWTNSGNVWEPIGASACPTCARWRCWRRGMGRASKPSATYARQQGWPQTLGCQENSGRSRQRWERCMRQGASLSKRTQRLLRQQRSSGGWPRASRMRHYVPAFWLGHRFTSCCSTSKAMLEEKTINQETKNRHQVYIFLDHICSPCC